MSVYLLAGYGPWIHTRFPANVSHPAHTAAYVWDARAFLFFVTLFCGMWKLMVLSMVIVQLFPTSWAPNLLSNTISG